MATLPLDMGPDEIRAIRKFLGKSQKKLAHAAFFPGDKMTQQKLSDFENIVKLNQYSVKLIQMRVTNYFHMFCIDNLKLTIKFISIISKIRNK